MYIYHKQCEITQKIQWNSSNGQLQPFMLIIASLMDASTFIFYQITEWTPNVCIFRVSRRFAEYLHCKQWNILPVFSCCSLLCFFNLSLCLNVLSQLEHGSFSVTLWVFFVWNVNEAFVRYLFCIQIVSPGHVNFYGWVNLLAKQNVMHSYHTCALFRYGVFWCDASLLLSWKISKGILRSWIAFSYYDILCELSTWIPR